MDLLLTPSANITLLFPFPFPPDENLPTLIPNLPDENLPTLIPTKELSSVQRAVALKNLVSYSLKFQDQLFHCGLFKLLLSWKLPVWK